MKNQVINCKGDLGRAIRVLKHFGLNKKFKENELHAVIVTNPYVGIIDECLNFFTEEEVTASGAEVLNLFPFVEVDAPLYWAYNVNKSAAFQTHLLGVEPKAERPFVCYTKKGMALYRKGKIEEAAGYIASYTNLTIAKPCI